MEDKDYMQRCIALALHGAGSVSPNPMVGSVLVHNGRVIGEGWHRRYGQAHAEVNCIASVSEADRPLIPQSTLYVSLEPCSHYGKTPPCADLIIAHKIPKVVIGCVDPFSKVAGRGIEKLQHAGIEVIRGVLETACRELNRRFFCRQENNRPYIILKWAQSANGYIAPVAGKRVMLSSVFSQKWVHRMRAEEDAILVGYRTALLDNPRLNNRYGTGKDPVRIVLDPKAALPRDLHVLDGSQQTLVFNDHIESEAPGLRYIRLTPGEDFIAQVLQHTSGINSIIVEGGAGTLKQFIDSGFWDEAFIIHTPAMITEGLPAPLLSSGILTQIFPLGSDRIHQYKNEHPGKLSVGQ